MPLRRSTVAVVAAALVSSALAADARAQAPSQAPTQNAAQATNPIEPALLAVPRRPETQAVVDACRDKGRQADTRHTLMVFRAAQEILKFKQGYPEIASADALTSEIAVMLHDIGGGGLANAHPGAVIARDVLTGLKERHRFSDAFIAKVARIVETHHVTGTVKGQDDGPEWFVVLLADTPRIYNAATGDRDVFAKLVQERIDQLKAAVRSATLR